MLRSLARGGATDSRARRGPRARTVSVGSLVLAMLLVVATAPAASGAEAEATAAPAGPASWDYRTVFVVWDEAATDWRADWNDGSSTVGLEAVLDNEGSEGWELDSIAHERVRPHRRCWHDEPGGAPPPPHLPDAAGRIARSYGDDPGLRLRAGLDRGDGRDDGDLDERRSRGAHGHGRRRIVRQRHPDIRRHVQSGPSMRWARSPTDASSTRT